MKLLGIAGLLFAAFAAWGQKPGQVAWTLATDSPAVAPGSTATFRLEAVLQPGWHLYSGTTAGATPLTVKALPDSPVARVRLFQPAPKRSFDPNFNTETETYEGKAVFLVAVELKPGLKAGPEQISLALRYQTCNDRFCVPGRQTLSAAIDIDPAARASAFSAPPGYSEAVMHAPESTTQGLGGFLALAFGFGLAAIFTPCVFPMIPITVSFFLNRKSSVFQALVFCLGIIVLFSGLGLAATALLGPFGVVQLGSNPWVNGFIALVFLLFGLSLLGAFEITIPSSVLTRLDRASQGGGVVGTLLMGLTFSLTSFACVGPFVGTLLAASVQGGGARPLMGMVSFASGLALPFFLLALFPAYLKRLPRSGGWMARVKVVMGFVILAAMLKYVAAVDQVLRWNWLTRERFLAAWVVLFGMAGLYLLGFVRLEGVDKDKPTGLGRLITGIVFLIFAISLLPGMFGGKLGDLDAYVPAGSAPGAASGTETGLAWMKNQYREALDRARREHKLVFVSFTGYACTNCHWMQANMFTRPEIAEALHGFVLVELYTDGTDAASQSNQELEQRKFSTVAIPYYAILDPDENVVASYPGLTKDPAEYLAFLRKGEAPAQASSGGPLGGAGLTSLDGTAFDPSRLNGKVAVVNFWATWCVPCIQEIPGFNRLHEQYSDKGVAVIGVSMDEDGIALVKPFLQKHPMKYPVALGSEKLSEQFQLNQLPVTLVFDRTGKQLNRFEGFTPEASIESAVKSAL